MLDTAQHEPSAASFGCELGVDLLLDLGALAREDLPHRVAREQRVDDALHRRAHQIRVEVVRVAPSTVCAMRRAVDSSSIVQVTGASAISEERTLQYFVTESSTARASFCALVPGAETTKCSTAAASRRGVSVTRCASTRTRSACTGVRCLARIDTTSVAAQVAIAARSRSKGLGAALASPSTRTLGPSTRPASNSLPRTHTASIGPCATVSDSAFIWKLIWGALKPSARPAPWPTAGALGRVGSATRRAPGRAPSSTLPLGSPASQAADAGDDP